MDVRRLALRAQANIAVLVVVGARTVALAETTETTIAHYVRSLEWHGVVRGDAAPISSK